MCSDWAIHFMISAAQTYLKLRTYSLKIILPTFSEITQVIILPTFSEITQVI